MGNYSVTQYFLKIFSVCFLFIVFIEALRRDAIPAAITKNRCQIIIFAARKRCPAVLSRNSSV